MSEWGWGRWQQSRFSLEAFIGAVLADRGSLLVFHCWLVVSKAELSLSSAPRNGIPVIVELIKGISVGN
jgi:hypothetical protein